MSIRAYLYDADGFDSEVGLSEEAVVNISDRRLLWVDVVGATEPELQQVSQLFSIGHEAQRMLLDPVGRPRLVNFGEYFELGVVAVRPLKNTRFGSVMLDIVAGKNWVITFHNEAAQFLQEFREQAHGDTKIGELPAVTFIAALLDWHLVTYFRVIENIEAQVDELDEEVLQRPIDRPFLSELVKLRRRVSELRRLLAPHRDVYYGLSRPDFSHTSPAGCSLYFSTLNQRFERALDSIENARDLVHASFDLFTTRTAQRTNDFVQMLTFVTVLLGVTSVIAGILGMNFEAPFFKTGAHGFWTAVAGMVLLGISTFVFARRRHWI